MSMPSGSTVTRAEPEEDRSLLARTHAPTTSICDQSDVVDNVMRTRVSRGPLVVAVGVTVVDVVELDVDEVDDVGEIDEIEDVLAIECGVRLVLVALSERAPSAGLAMRPVAEAGLAAGEETLRLATTATTAAPTTLTDANLRATTSFRLHSSPAVGRHPTRAGGNAAATRQNRVLQANRPSLHQS
jgi:hypothetical protein